jgi:hypothetical protein
MKRELVVPWSIAPTYSGMARKPLRWSWPECHPRRN